MSTPYNVVTFDTAVVTDFPQKIAQTNGKEVVAISVTAAPTGGESYLRIGADTADRIRIAPNRSLQLTVTPERDGVFFENIVGLVGEVELVISYRQPCDPAGTAGLVVANL